MKEKMSYLYRSIKSTFKLSKYFEKKESSPNTIAADLIRKVHSIEKGLSIKDIKLGFGHKKQEEMIEMIKQLQKYDSSYYNEVIKMAISVLNSYIKYHESQNYHDDFMDKLKEFINQNKSFITENYGGVLELDFSKVKFNIPEIENFFESRHSIRNFCSKPVDEETLKKALKLAQRCPSACNRQGVRAYVVDKNKAAYITDQLAGIGGFAKEIDKLVIITAKLSSYKYDEINQYIVSASIYAGYLTLTLHLYGLGACVIQRPVIWTKEWNDIQKKYNIPSDEQVICMVGVGNVEGKVNVPISHRIDIDEFAKFIK